MAGKKLQDISFKASSYPRPLDGWRCGTREGGPCPLGPSHQGVCRGAAECSPKTSDDGQAWYCTRSDDKGGPCQAGPTASGACGSQRLACRPVNNWYRRRTRFALLLGLFCLAVAVGALTFDWWRVSVNAGELSRHHASLVESGCEGCHTMAEQPRSSWPAAVLSIFKSDDGQASDIIGLDSQKCLACHQMGDESHSPHMLTQASLASLTMAARRKSFEPAGSLLLQAARDFNGSPDMALECNSCHMEHRGSDSVITEVTDQQCALCHTQVFDSFAHHPDFERYPAKRRTRIKFSHNSHFFLHFKEPDMQELKPSGCNDCHQTDGAGRKMVMTDFESSCSTCHTGQIAGASRATEKGLAILAIPALDTDTLQQRGVQIGEWPEDTDAEITSFMLLLLSYMDVELAAQLPVIQDLELYDLRSASSEQLEVVYKVAWRTKQLFYELQRGGASTMLSRVTGYGLADTDNEFLPNQLAGLLPPSLVDQVVGESFPQLQTEMQQWLQQGTPEFSAVNPVEGSTSAAEETAQSSGGEDDDWLAQQVSEDGGDDWFEDEGDDIALDDDAWLEEEGDDAIADDDSWLDEASDDDFSDDDWLDEDSEADPFADEDEFDEVASSESDLPQASIEDRAAAGGWYEENRYLRYRPSGHADPFITEWVSFAIANLADRQTGWEPVLTTITNPGSPGSCFKCHSLEEVGPANDKTIQVNWLSFRQPLNDHDFNRFRHESHFGLVSNEDSGHSIAQPGGCQSCHALNREADSAESYSQMDAMMFDSDFQDMNREVCTDCHENNEALSQCTVCHNYHIGVTEFVHFEKAFDDMEN